MKKLFVLAALLALPTPALAQWANGHPPSVLAVHPAAPAAAPMGAPRAEDTIVAVVNDNVITTVDLNQRIRLAILSSGLPDKPDVREHLMPQILRGLIDEQLQTQEAKRLDLSVSSEEINEALAHIASDNHIDGDMREFVAAHGASPDALIDQIRSGLLWNKVIQHELRPHVEVGDDEIDALINRIHADAGKEEYLTSEIYLSVDNPKDDDQVKQVADNLVAQLRNGANFSAVARQFSQDSSAAQGGDIGWIQQGQLAPELNRALAESSVGAISAPIHTGNGYHILGVRDKRTVSLGDPTKTSVDLMQLFHPYDASSKDKVLSEAGSLGGAIKSCADMNNALTSFPGWKAQKMNNVVLAKAPGWLTDKINGVPVNGATGPLATDKGAVVLFVCARNEGGAVDRDAIMHSIGTEKLELQARRLLRDLRRAAYLDVRLGKSS